MTTEPCPHAWEEINPGHWMCKELCGTPDVDLTRSPDWLATKALVETATRLGVELGKVEGRKQAGEEIAQRFEESVGASLRRAPAERELLRVCAAVARDITSRPQEAISEPLTAPAASPRTPEAERARSIRIPRGEG